MPECVYVYNNSTKVKFTACNSLKYAIKRIACIKYTCKYIYIYIDICINILSFQIRNWYRYKHKLPRETRILVDD